MSNQNPVFIPGPTNIPDRLRLAMHTQTSDHRAPDFVEVFSPILEDTKKVFGTTSGKVILYPATGTGGWEAAMSNLLAPGDKILVGRFGTFSERWVDLCERHGLDVHVIDVEWGRGSPADQFAEILAADKNHEYKAVLATHCETATGVQSDVAAVRRGMDASKHPAMLFVDCVSSLASMEFKMDEWGVDAAISGSQKGFMLMTGMAILCVSEKALEKIEGANLPRTYFDFRDMLRANAAGGFPYTPPLQLIFGLGESLKMLFEEGLDNVYARHYRLAEGVRKAITDGWGFELVAKTPELASDTVSAIYVPDGKDSNELTEHAYNTYGVSFGIGLGQLNGKAFRIGHLGSLTDVMVLSGLATIEMAMADLDYPIKLGSGVSAAQEYYRTSARKALKSAA